jgi:hypothetical protein
LPDCIEALRPALPHIIWFIGFSSFAGASMPIALFSDMLSILTLHIYSFYIASARSRWHSFPLLDVFRDFSPLQSYLKMKALPKYCFSSQIPSYLGNADSKIIQSSTGNTPYFSPCSNSFAAKSTMFSGNVSTPVTMTWTNSFWAPYCSPSSSSYCQQ